MKRHRDRMTRIGRGLGRVVAGGMPPEQMERAAELLRELNGPQRAAEGDRLAKQMWMTARTRYTATLENGAGLMMDKELRAFYDDYNNRILQNPSADALPASFQILEAFFRWNESLMMFDLREERDHSFCFTDFVEFATSADAPKDPFKAAYALEEGIIYSYNSTDDPHDLQFSGPDGAEFGIGGLSLVRDGDEVTVLAVAGKACDVDEARGQLTDLSTAKNLKPWLRVGRQQPHGVVTLTGTSDLWKRDVAIRLDLSSGAEEVRYLLVDEGDLYLVRTDDPVIYRELQNPEKRRQESIDAITAEAVLFEVSRTSLLLPAYFAFKIRTVRTKQLPTKLKNSLEHSGRRRSEAKTLPPGQRVIFRTVAALEILDPVGSRPVTRFSAPRFQVQVDGFWRRLDPSSIGKGRSGEPLQGRTWVSGHLRWRDRPVKPIEVLVKSRISIARAIAAADKLAASVEARESQPPSEGPPSAPGRVSRSEAYEERRKLTSRLRWAILARDNFRCQRCGADAAADNAVRLEVDHKVAIANGGKTEPPNLWTLCSVCNNGKGALLSAPPRSS